MYLPAKFGNTILGNIGINIPRQGSRMLTKPCISTSEELTAELPTEIMIVHTMKR
jgi:hypothetical protein